MTNEDLSKAILEKVLLGIIAFLLLILVFNQNTKVSISKECNAAREFALSIIENPTYRISGTNYETAVYGARVDNINQQILLANEMEFKALRNLADYQEAILLLMTVCP